MCRDSSTDYRPSLNHHRHSLVPYGAASALAFGGLHHCNLFLVRHQLFSERGRLALSCHDFLQETFAMCLKLPYFSIFVAAIAPSDDVDNTNDKIICW